MMRPGSRGNEGPGASRSAPLQPRRVTVSTTLRPECLHSPALSACAACGEQPVYQGECCIPALIATPVITKAVDVIARNDGDFIRASNEALQVAGWCEAMEGRGLAWTYWRLVVDVIAWLRRREIDHPGSTGGLFR